MRRRLRWWIVQYCCAFALALGTMAAVNWYYDPFTIFRDDGRYLRDPRYQRFVHVGLLRNTKSIRSLVVGTSYVANFDPDLTAELFGGPAHILSTWGASQRENNEALRFALRHHPEIQTVLFEISMGNVCSTTLHPLWTFPEALYRDRVVGLIGYLLSSEATWLSWREWRGHKTFTADARQVPRWWDIHIPAFGRVDIIERSYAADRPRPDKQFIVPQADLDRRLSERVDCFANNILPLARQHRNVRFVFFNPPSMQWRLWAFNMRGWLEVYLQAQERIAALLEGETNAMWFDFYPAMPLVSDCKHWRDTTHFDLEVADNILLWIKTERFRRTPATSAQLSQLARKASSSKMDCGKV